MTVGLETEVLAHRYLYYVLAEPIISDRAYDELEARAKPTLPATSLIHLPGSDRAQDYPPEAVLRAAALQSAANR